MKNTAARGRICSCRPSRDAREGSRLGIAGNLTLDEAVTLAVENEAPAMIAHHHGLFAFHTLPVAD